MLACSPIWEHDGEKPIGVRVPPVRARGSKMRKDSCFAAMPGLMAVLLALGPAAPAAAADPAAGRALAERWCASCHAVAPDSGDSDVVPSFERIAEERQLTEESLTVWLAEPHQSMPSLTLTRQEIADLTAYFHSLR